MTVIEIKAKLFDLDQSFKQIQERYKRQAQELYKQLEKKLAEDKEKKDA